VPLAAYCPLPSSCRPSFSVRPSLSIASEWPGKLPYMVICDIKLNIRQRDADRAPPMVVLSLPERVWTPDIAWEKDDSSSDPDTTPTASPKAPSSRPPFISMHSSRQSIKLPPPPPISAEEAADLASETALPSSSQLQPAVAKQQKRRKSQKYFSNDECAICMESFERGEIVRILPCGHVFHKDECDEWLMKWRKLVSTGSQS
jgi:hypothetical protein